MLNMTRPLMYNPTLILVEGGGGERGRPVRAHAVRAHAGVSIGNVSIFGGVPTSIW